MSVAAPPRPLPVVIEPLHRVAMTGNRALLRTRTTSMERERERERAPLHRSAPMAEAGGGAGSAGEGAACGVEGESNSNSNSESKSTSIVRSRTVGGPQRLSLHQRRLQRNTSANSVAAVRASASGDRALTRSATAITASHTRTCPHPHPHARTEDNDSASEGVAGRWRSLAELYCGSAAGAAGSTERRVEGGATGAGASGVGTTGCASAADPDAGAGAAMARSGSTLLHNGMQSLSIGE